MPIITAAFISSNFIDFMLCIPRFVRRGLLAVATYYRETPPGEAFDPGSRA